MDGHVGQQADGENALFVSFHDMADRYSVVWDVEITVEVEVYE